MKVFKLDVDRNVYSEMKDIGEMLPFGEKSLVVQILDYLKKDVLLAQGNLLVFSESEKFQIEELSRHVVGGIVMDKGLDHVISSFDIFIVWVFAKCGLVREYIPADGNANQKICDIKDWLLAARY